MGALEKCSIDRVEPAKQLGEVLRARWRSSSRARWRSPWSSAHRPSPRTRTCWRCRCRRPRLFGVGRDRDEVLGDRRFVAEALDEPLARRVALVRVSRVPNVFEEMMKSVSSAAGRATASTKSVASTLETKRKVRSRRESGEGLRRPSPVRGPTPRCRY